jgi:hypothetical protein
MALWQRNKTKVVVKRAEAKPAEPEDPQARQDAEDQARVAAAQAAFLAEVVKNGYHWPSDPSPTLQDHRERLRDGRSRW